MANSSLQQAETCPQTIESHLRTPDQNPFSDPTVIFQSTDYRVDEIISSEIGQNLMPETPPNPALPSAQNQVPKSNSLTQKPRKKLYEIQRFINPVTKRVNQTIYCKLCPYKGSKLGNVVDHIRIHTMEEPYACRFCDKHFSLMGNRRRHERMLTCLGRQVQKKIKSEHVNLIF